LRYVGAVLLVVIAVVHLNLYWRENYRLIPTIGWLFLVTVIAAVALAVAMIVRPHLLVAVAATLFALGTLGSYAFALTRPLFGFEEPGISYSGGVAIAAEAGCALAIGAWAWLDWRSSR
jgi:vacuolar-type H+-ATPase subunit I/STV1